MRQPIDFVVPMVFPDDKRWQEDFARWHTNDDATTHARWRSWGAEELMVRCVQKFMPWLRTIYIILARESQVQGWMNEMVKGSRFVVEGDGPEVRVVFHEEFIPKEYLPCFTSPTIEMFLHRIPGLADQFIYANDDMFVLAPLADTDFFRDGRPCQILFEKTFPENPNVFQRKCRRQQALVAEKFVFHLDNRWLKNGHCFAPILKSSCEAVWREWEAQIAAGISPSFRTEFSYNHYLYVLWQHFTGNYVCHPLPRDYAGKRMPTAELREAILSAKGLLCINDNANEHDWRQRAEIAKTAIEEILNRS